MRLFIIIAATMLFIPAFGQSDPHSLQLFQSFGDSRHLYNGLQPKSSGIKGSPFILDNMAQGDIIMKNGKHYQGMFINIFPEKAEIYIKGDESEDAKVVVLNRKIIEQIIFIEPERIFSPMKVDGKDHIAEILIEDGQEKLIALHEKRFHKAIVGGGYNEGPKYDTYQHIIRYFVIEGDSVEEIAKGKSGLKTLGKDSWKSLQKYAKDNKLDRDNPQDMKQLYHMARGK